MIFGSVIDAKEDPKRGPTPPLLERSSAEEFALIAVVRFSLLSRGPKERTHAPPLREEQCGRVCFDCGGPLFVAVALLLFCG